MSAKAAGKQSVRLPAPDLGQRLEEAVVDALSPDHVLDAIAAARTAHADYSEPPLMAGALPASGSTDATAGARSVFVENFSLPSTPGANVHRSCTVAGPSLSHRAPKAANLRLNTSVPVMQAGSSSWVNGECVNVERVNEERSPYVETYDERLGRRITVVDGRPSTVAEHLAEQQGAQHLEHVDTVEEVSHPSRRR